MILIADLVMILNAGPVMILNAGPAVTMWDSKSSDVGLTRWGQQQALCTELSEGFALSGL